MARFLAREGDATQRSRIAADDPIPEVDIPVDVEGVTTFVAEARDDRLREDAIVGLANWRALSRPGTAEAAMIVSTGWGAQGVGRMLVEAVVADATRRGIHTLLVPVIPRNGALRAALREAGLHERRTVRGRRDVAAVAIAPPRAASVA
ncbi:MAG: GNAT family N-acetyltransferase [Actinomycetota bacterium]